MYQGIITSINTPDFRTAIEEINKIKDKTSQLQINLFQKQRSVIYHYHPPHCDCPHYMPCSFPNFLALPILKNEYLKQVEQIVIRFYGDLNKQKWLEGNYDQDSLRADQVKIYSDSWADLAFHLTKLIKLKKMRIQLSKNNKNPKWNKLLLQKNIKVQIIENTDWLKVQQEQNKLIKLANQKQTRCTIY